MVAWAIHLIAIFWQCGKNCRISNWDTIFLPPFLAKEMKQKEEGKK